jgi:hypothetical protein
MRWGGEESRCRREVWVIGDGVHITTTKGGWLAFTSWVAFWFGLEFGLPDWFGTAWGQHFLTYYYDTPIGEPNAQGFSCLLEEPTCR